MVSQRMGNNGKKKTRYVRGNGLIDVDRPSNVLVVLVVIGIVLE